MQIKEAVTIIRFIMFIIRLMPHRLALAFGRSLGRLLRLILWKKTDRCESRCVMSLGIGITTAREIIRKFFMHFGMSVIEFIRVPVMKPRIKDFVNFQPESVKLFRESIEKGKGVIVMDTHMAVLPQKVLKSVRLPRSKEMMQA